MNARDLLRYRKDPRVVVALPVMIVIITSGIYYLTQRAKELSPEALSSRLLLFVLWNINLILIIGIVFVLLRVIVKVLLERQRGVSGSRFRSRLVATYVATSLVPIVLLFVVATDFLRISIDRWFTSPVRTILGNSAEIAEMAQDQALERAFAAAAAAARDLQSDSPADRALDRIRRDHRIDLAGLYRDGALVTMRADPRAPTFEAPDPPQTFFERVATEGSATRIDVGLRGKWLRAAAPAGTEGTVVVAGVFMPLSASRMLDQNMVAWQQFQQLDTQKETFKTSQTMLFLAITLSILFGTLWTAMYASKRITGPVVALADGTRTLAEGKLGHRINLKASDEFAVLIDSFNRMADEIESKRTALTRSNEELQRVNRSLGEERAYLSTVLESVSTGIIAISSEGAILSANPAAQRMLALAHDPAGRSMSELLAGDLKPVCDAVREATAGQAREISIQREGETRYLEIAAAPLRGGDMEGAFVVAIEDLTRLVQAQKLAAWSEAARRIAHEIKNPLTPIQLSAERLLRKASEGSPDLGSVIERACTTIISEVRQLKNMVDEFSRFARMPAVHLKHTPLREVLEPAVNLYRDVKPGVEITLAIDEDLKALLDAEQIRRAVINLLDNAVDATESGLIEVSASRREHSVVIEVTDPGRGIPPSDRDKLFTPYFSTKEKGTGLGLAIVSRIVHDHDGRISVHDNEPSGTRFEIELPG